MNYTIVKITMPLKQAFGKSLTKTVPLKMARMVRDRNRVMAHTFQLGEQLWF
jgi:hypothetical protein